MEKQNKQPAINIYHTGSLRGGNWNFNLYMIAVEKSFETHIGYIFAKSNVF